MLGLCSSIIASVKTVFVVNTLVAAPVNVTDPYTTALPPTYKSLAIPTPPFTINAPVVLF